MTFCQQPLLGRQRSYSPEHADLALDVSPLSGSVLGDQIVVEPLTHADDAVSHVLDLTLPLLVQLRLVQDSGSNTCAMYGWVGVHGSDDDLEL